ncbi:MAG: sensor histidine kinase [Synechococcales bacterium]|nr:sensor histidine kinase [Synechococcales bacterium]
MAQIPPRFLRSLQYIEWVILAVHLVSGSANGSFSESIVNSLVILAFLGVLFWMSLNLPIQGSPWRQRAYVWAGLLLVTFAQVIGLFITLFLYLYIAKACFLLRRRELIFTTIIAGVLDVTTLLILVSQLSGDEVAIAPASMGITSLIADDLGEYVAVSTFVIIFCFTAISEYQNRQQVEILAQQVETLATTLERTRIARDIHDSLGHTLTTLNVHLAVALRLYRQDGTAAFQALNTAKGLADQSIEDVNRTLRTLRESDFDLAQALVGVMEQLKLAQSLRVHWQIDLPPLPLSTRYQIYCIVKEGLVNVQKHAQATEVWVQCQRINGAIALKIEDNGRGFDPTAIHAGFGLQGMRERVQMLAGELVINSSTRGTQLHITLPYRTPETAS